jgi:hypothetical protein
MEYFLVRYLIELGFQEVDWLGLENPMEGPSKLEQLQRLLLSLVDPRGTHLGLGYRQGYPLTVALQQALR